MNATITIIKDEHRSMAAVLKGLINHLDEVQSGREEPDVHLILAMLDYIQAFPERLHHPKEDEYLFRFLRLRSQEADGILDALEAQHVQGVEFLNRLRLQLEKYRESGNVDAFDKALRDYAEFHFEHMRQEEDLVLPLAEKHLTSEDWQTIEAAFSVNRDRAW